ncbi:MAG TPA: intradiol ring-cleavage dioxygenase [Rhizobiaceae bacterium]|nr:intradiol ring-cleavage dioxygenase [Rhizobiaceae bacterium]
MTTRRTFLSGFLALPAIVPVVARGQNMPELALTPSCGAETVAQTEGPYFTPDTPLKRDFRGDVASDANGGGTPITIAGYVLTADCKPVPGALIELWHCDDGGVYDNDGFRLRGHQFSDGEGRWWFETIVPGVYTGRTRHFHVKVQRPEGPVLTTQLYFPGEAGNDRDRIFDASLLLDIKTAPDGGYGRYDFVVG